MTLKGSTAQGLFLVQWVCKFSIPERYHRGVPADTYPQGIFFWQNKGFVLPKAQLAGRKHSLLNSSVSFSKGRVQLLTKSCLPMSLLEGTVGTLRPDYSAVPIGSCREILWHSLKTRNSIGQLLGVSLADSLGYCVSESNISFAFNTGSCLVRSLKRLVVYQKRWSTNSEKFTFKIRKKFIKYVIHFQYGSLMCS